MLNRGLLYKTWRETWHATLLFGIGFFAFELILAYIFPDFIGQLSEQMLNIPFVRAMLGGLLGVDITDNLTASALGAFAWVHPVMLAMLWAQAIMFATRVPAGEVDRGTADVTLSLPVSRRQIYLAESAGLAVSALFLMACGLAGNALGASWTGEAPLVPLGGTLLILANLLTLQLAVGALALLVSCGHSRRGGAIGLAFALVLGSFFLNFLAQLWRPAAGFSFLSLMEYYRPVQILRAMSLQPGHVATLAIFAAACWLAGAWLFERRDIAAG